MPSWLPSFPYHVPLKGYWYPQTSTINWCEEDYYLGHLIAEPLNAFTNLAFVALGLRGLHNSLSQKHDPVIVFGWIGYLVVGLGSFLFHASLKYPMQLVDELSMIYSVCIMLFATFSHKRLREEQWLLGMLMTAIAGGVTGYYHYVQNPKFHQDTFAVLVLVALARMSYVSEIDIRPRNRDRGWVLIPWEKKVRGWFGDDSDGTHEKVEKKVISEKEKARRDERDLKLLNVIWKCAGCGVVCCLFAFQLWTLDNRHCTTLLQWRHHLGLPWGILLEGHAWWHIFTSLGAYYLLTSCVLVRQCLNGRQDDIHVQWPSLWTSVPLVLSKQRLPHPQKMQKG